jgi:hypothetical protein
LLIGLGRHAAALLDAANLLLIDARLNNGRRHAHVVQRCRCQFEYGVDLIGRAGRVGRRLAGSSLNRDG